MVRWLRWAGVLPAAILASVAIEYIPEIAFMMVALVLHEAGDLIYVAQLLSLPFYVAREAGFVIAGAKVAPQGRVATAIVLATMRLPLSLATHVLLQTHRGTTNYLHLVLESTGALLGVTYIALSERARARLHPGSVYCHDDQAALNNPSIED
jgi:hypothetical protein